MSKKWIGGSLFINVSRGGAGPASHSSPMQRRQRRFYAALHCALGGGKRAPAGSKRAVRRIKTREKKHD